MSVTESEDKPLKYPTIFNTADVAVITKMDMTAAAEFDRETAERNIQSVRPNIRYPLPAKTGQGMAEPLDMFTALRKPAVVGGPLEAFSLVPVSWIRGRRRSPNRARSHPPI